MMRVPRQSYSCMVCRTPVSCRQRLGALFKSYYQQIQNQTFNKIEQAAIAMTLLTKAAV